MYFEAVLSCLLVVLTIVWIYCRSSGSAKKYPKGPWGIPVLGHLPFFGAFPTETFRKWSEKHGNVFMIRLGSWNTVVVNGEKAITEIGSKKDAFSGRPPFGTRDIMKEVYGGVESLTFTNFDASYLQHRKLTKKGLRIYTYERDNELEDLIVEEAINMIDNNLKHKEDNVSFFHNLASLSANILFQLFYGKGNDALKSEKMTAMLDVHDGFMESVKSGNAVDVLPWLKYFKPNAVKTVKKMMETYHSAAKENIDEHIKSFDSQNIRDLTDVFLSTKLEEDVENDDQSKGISRRRLLYTLLDLYTAGTQTVSSALRWLFLYMIEFQEVQQRVFEEINNTIGQSRRIEWADHLNLPYTNAVLKEVMRMQPILPFGLLHYTTEETKLDNLDIDKDTVVMINFHSVSHDRNFWGDPQNFRPERYLLANGELDPVKLKYERTFSVGRRMCMGEDLANKELFLILSTLIQRYVFSKPESTVSNFEPVVGITYSPKPYRVLVNERK